MTKSTSQQTNRSVELLLGCAADEYTQRLSDGEQPDVEEYAGRYPEIASVIRQVFPALGVLHTRTRPPSGETGPSSAGGTPLGQLGDYQIMREIGRGGMGVVYEAEQTSLGRRVALKVLPLAAVLDQRQLERFRREAQAAAQLHHSNIVPVFSVGCERGVHYYAMQYIDGQPLSAVVEELSSGVHVVGPDGAAAASSDEAAGLRGRSASHAWAALLSRCTGSSALLAAGGAEQVVNGRPAEPADFTATTPAFFAAVAQLGIQAAEALQHAHNCGIIHRDIKPANLLLDSGGHLWVTDFGLARVLNDASLTMTGDVLGTLRYMSPEQTGLELAVVDHRTDVYSLGITLYELLSLQPAHAGENRAELLRRITDESPQPLRRANPAAPRELETIIGKAISKDARDRYRSAQDLADDLRRFLADRPILAKPPTLLTRASKWARRHRGVVATSVSMLFLAVIGLSISTVMIALERAEAIRQRDAARDSRQLAESSLRLARDSVDRLLTQVTFEELGGQPQMERMRETLLRDTLAFREHGLSKMQDDAAARRETAHAYTRVGHINALLGQDVRSEEAYRSAIREYEALHARFPDLPVMQAELAGSHMFLATMFWEHGRYQEAEGPARRAVALLEDLIARQSEGIDPRESLAGALNLLGLVSRDQGYLPDAAELLRKARALRLALVVAAPESAPERVELGRVLRNYSGVALRLGRRDEAQQAIDQTLALQQALVDEFPGDLEFGAELAYTRRWWAEASSGDPQDGAIRDAERATRVHDLVSQMRMEAPWYAEHLARSYHELDVALRGIGRADLADGARQRATETQLKLVADQPEEPLHRRNLALLYIEAAHAAAVAWQLDRAETGFQAAAEILGELTDAEPDDAEYQELSRRVHRELACVRGHRNVGQLMALASESPEGVAEAVAIAVNTDAASLGRVPLTLLIHGEYLLLGGEHERSAALIQRAIDASGDAPAYYYKSLGMALLGCNQPEAAQRAFEQACGPYLDWTPPPTQACPDYWTAAYYLDWISTEQYTDRWANTVLFGKHFAPFAWFYVGMRAELEGRLDEAVDAYGQAVERGSLPSAHHSANWAAYRLNKLETLGLSAATRTRSARALSSRHTNPRED